MEMSERDTIRVVRGCIYIGLSLVLFFFSFVLLKDYLIGNEAEIKKYEQLLVQGKETVAQLSKNYQEHSIKIKGVDIKSYQVRYVFEADGTQYSGKHRFDDLSYLNTHEEIPVFYLPHDPDLHEVELEAKLEKAKNQQARQSNLNFGLGCLLPGLLLFGFGLYKIKKAIRNKRNQSGQMP